MSIETPHEYGGSEASFTTAIIAIEELAKVDPSVSVMADVHVCPCDWVLIFQNTLVNTTVRQYGSPRLKEKYLSQLSHEKLGSFCLSEPASGSDAFVTSAAGHS
jgi:short/branched chain acyl-CoA dehydrogenase